MGRHREFDVEAVLHEGLKLFWRHGYEGASMSELSKATGVAVPGLYAAFGNKEAFFLKAVDAYESTYMRFIQKALAQPTADKVIETLLRENAKLLVGKTHPPGCLGINGALACSDDGEAMRLELVRRRLATEQALAQRLACADLALPAAVEPEALARYVMTLTQGMAVQAKAGAGLRQLNGVIDLALGALRFS